MKMKAKEFSEVIEEIKNMPQESYNNFALGEEFEEWLKTRKQH